MTFPRKLSLKQKDVIRRSFANGRYTQREIAQQYLVSTTTISRVLKYAPRAEDQIVRNAAVVAAYVAANRTTASIAEEFEISPRQVQRIAKSYGVIREQAEANKLMARYKDYHRLPAHLRKQRKQISSRVRYEMIARQPWCTLCGARPEDGHRLEIDHIDNDATNNDIANLQVLCRPCNHGKIPKGEAGKRYYGVV